MRETYMNRDIVEEIENSDIENAHIQMTYIDNSYTDNTHNEDSYIENTETLEESLEITEDGLVLQQEHYLQVCELVPVEVQRENDMEKIAEMIEKFSQSMDPILSMYNSAMSVTISRLEIIKDEFHFRKQRCPIHHIDSRLKSAKSILGKLNKKGMEPTLTVACNNIFDIAGIRVVCPYVKDVYLIRDRILAQDDVEIMNIKDYIAHPKKNGYRSLHMTIRVPVYFMNKKQMVPVEMQIRTQAMDLWASLEHDIKYKSLYQNKGFINGEYSEVDFDKELQECSRLIYEAQAKMEALNQILEG